MQRSRAPTFGCGTELISQLRGFFGSTALARVRDRNHQFWGDAHLVAKDLEGPLCFSGRRFGHICPQPNSSTWDLPWTITYNNAERAG